jgi:hypothetical protein
MLYLNNTGTTTLTVWPEVSSSYLPGSGSLRLKLTDDLSEEFTYVPATLLNTPTAFTPRLIFSVTASDLPTVSGQYTVEIQEYIPVVFTWGNANVKWGEANFTWGTGAGFSGLLVLDNDRAYNEGTDVPTATLYTSPDEIGRYTVYNG